MPRKIDLEDIRSTWTTAEYEDWYPGMHRDHAREDQRGADFDSFIEELIAQRALELQAKAEGAERLRSYISGAPPAHRVEAFTAIVDAWVASMVADGPEQSEATATLEALMGRY